MPDFDNTNRGALFRNDDKQSDTHPDYKGSINVGGTEFWLSAWLKTSKAGAKYMSLSVTPKEKQAAKPPRNAPPADDFEDAPF